MRSQSLDIWLDEMRHAPFWITFELGSMSKLGGRFYTEEELQEAGFKSLGKNVKIHNRASIYCPEKISIGNNVRIDDFCVLIATGGIDIGKYVHIANFCYLGWT